MDPTHPHSIGLFYKFLIEGNGPLSYRGELPLPQGKREYYNAKNVEPDYRFVERDNDSNDNDNNNRFAEDNKYFIQLSNIIHEAKAIKEMEKLIQKRRIATQEEYVQIVQYSDTKCSQKKWTFENFSSSTAAVYKDEISDLTLTSSVGRYFKFMFCPDYDPTVHDFYYNLLLKVHNSSQLQPETVLKTLARVIVEAKIKKQTEHYNLGKPQTRTVKIFSRESNSRTIRPWSVSH